MFFVFDSVLTPLIVIGVFVYFALQRANEKLHEVSKEEEEKRWVEFVKDYNLRHDPENIRYQNWLYRHRPKE